MGTMTSSDLYNSTARLAIAMPPNQWLPMVKSIPTQIAHSRVKNWRRGKLPAAFRGRPLAFRAKSAGYGSGLADVEMMHLRPTFPLTERLAGRVEMYARELPTDPDWLLESYLASSQHDVDKRRREGAKRGTPTPPSAPTSARAKRKAERNAKSHSTYSSDCRLPDAERPNGAARNFFAQPCAECAPRLTMPDPAAPTPEGDPS